MAGLERFKQAQDLPESGFDAARAEIRHGGKRGHWIWYVFPQLAGLGISNLSQTYAIRDFAEAVEYLQDSVLSRRLLAMTTEVAQQLTGEKRIPLRELMGSQVDVYKLVSSLTLFRSAAQKLAAADDVEDYRSMVRAAEQVLTVAESEGYPPCSHTLDHITRAG